MKGFRSKWSMCKKEIKAKHNVIIRNHVTWERRLLNALARANMKTTLPLFLRNSLKGILRLQLVLLRWGQPTKSERKTVPSLTKQYVHLQSHKVQTWKTYHWKSTAGFWYSGTPTYEHIMFFGTCFVSLIFVRWVCFFMRLSLNLLMSIC
jgi:hypothetical protein